jgi:hypothetical protein
MKRVKYIIGVGGIIPALGILATAGTPAAAASHPPKKAGKTVSLQHARGTAADTVCNPKSESYNPVGKSGDFTFSVFRSKNHCIAATFGLEHGSVGGGSLSMRTRLYENGVQYQAPFAPANSISPFIYSYSLSGINHKASKVCGALVHADRRTEVAWGPICKDT